jgi:hypothetical protein
VRALADGRVVVNDGAGAGILVFSADGEFEQAIGRHGDGPGEYGDFFNIATYGSDEIILHDCNRARLTRYAIGAGTSVQWITAGCRGNADPILDGEGAVWIADRVGGEDGGDRRPVLLKWNADGQVSDTFFLPPQSEAKVWIANGGAVPVPFSPYTITAGAPVSAWTGHGASLTFHRLSASSDTTRIASIPGGPAQIPDSVRSASIAWAANSPRFADAVKLDDVPVEQPLFRELSVDEQGRLWVHRPIADGSTGHFEVLDSSGVWLGTVKAPRGSLRGLRWANGRMYRISESADGTPTIEVYRIEEHHQ